MNAFKFVPSTELIARIEDQLSNYVQQGILDSGLFYEQIRFVLFKLGVSVFEEDEVILKLEDHKTLLPCGFYMLESAWLCHEGEGETWSEGFFRNNFVYYSQKTCERMAVPVCGVLKEEPIQGGIVYSVDACHSANGLVVDKITVTDKIKTNTGLLSHYFHKPTLLKLTKKSIKNSVCRNDCRNLFASSPHEISINQQGSEYALYSTLKSPTIFLRYYKFPIEEETGLPMIPEDPILQRAIEYYLMHYFFNIAWLNNSIDGLENKVKVLRQDRDLYMAEALNYVKMPSFQDMMNLIQRTRRKFGIYEKVYK